MKYLFWNTYHNEAINDILSALIVENNVSIAVLAEYSAKIDELIAMLGARGITMKHYRCPCPRITMLGTIDEVEMKNDSTHATIQIINGRDILCGVHLNSKKHEGHVGRREILIEQIVREIEKIEKEIGTENTIIVGDFNINPYEPDCIDARYFHGIPVLAEAERKTREVVQREYRMFYNPMWNLLGDYTWPYGTYYYNTGETQNTYWNIFDQVIIRPALKERFVKESLKILAETRTKSLLDDKGHPDKIISDHLPILFEIKEEISYE